MLPALTPPGQVLHHPDPTAAVQPLLGIPYVNDGVLDRQGNWVSFTHPELPLAAPGLNCSGFVVAAARRLLGCRLDLEQITRDRLGDSGPGAAKGKDWDFGWDLILNLSEGHARHWLLPEGDQPVGPGDGRSPQGFRVQDGESWARILPRMKIDRVYLATFRRNHSGALRHHHAAMLLRDSAGSAWLYQTLPGGRSHRLEISSPQGFERLCSMFGRAEWILILEVASDAR